MKKTGDILDILAGPSRNTNKFTHRSPINLHEFYLSGHIESSEEYVDWFDIIRNSGPNDIIKIYINSYGGDLFTAIQFYRVLKETEASIIVSVEGACMSAATILFLCGDQVEVSEHSMFMFHNYSGGARGKGGEMLDQLLHERTWSEKLMRDVYNDFLTDEEIDAMLDNKDIWMDGEQVIERLHAKIEKQKDVEEELVEDVVEEEVPAKKTRKRKVKSEE